MEVLTLEFEAGTIDLLEQRMDLDSLLVEAIIDSVRRGRTMLRIQERDFETP